MPRDHGRKNDEFTQLDRRKTVARLYCAGKSQWDIAKEVGCEQGTVSKDLTVIRNGWLASAILDWDVKKADELLKIDHIEARMWEAYEKSCELEVIRTSSVKKELQVRTEGKGKDRKVISEEMEPTESTSKKQSKQLIGDTRYIERIQWCIEMRCRLLGFLDKEKSGAPPLQINLINWDQVADVQSDPIEERLALEKAKVVEVRENKS